ncbi:MAG: hypothetical protein JWN57_485, partial [Frankiales bacterium]|nr:hypothetical protein [Frankiales bacterium]
VLAPVTVAPVPVAPGALARRAYDAPARPPG